MSRTDLDPASPEWLAYERAMHGPGGLVKTTAARFNVERISADKAYSGRTNLSVTEKVGAQPLIPFKINANPYGTDAWGRAYHYFMFNREQFLRFYHARSNVETTFHMVKAKFGSRIRSKTPVAQHNEIVAKLICHNLCCLVHAIYELGVEATFWQFPAA